MGSHVCDRVTRLGLIITLFAALSGCSNRSTEPEDDGEPEPLIHEPWEDEEAELLALLMSGELCAPRDLYERVHQDLALIRSEWGDSIPDLRKVTYTPMWYTMGLILGVDEPTYQAIEKGQYTAWDSLNALFEVDSIVPFEQSDGGSFYVGIGFGAHLNPRQTFDAYTGLPGVESAFSSTHAGDWPNVYGFTHESGPVYLFRDAWGDCLSGCIWSHFWYFRSTNEGLSYVGGWLPTEEGQTPPSWWEEASLAVDLYYGEDRNWWWEP